MKCPKCGQKLRQSKKNPDKMLCDNCRKSYWIDDLEGRILDSGRPTQDMEACIRYTVNHTVCIRDIPVMRCGLANTLEENGEVGGSAGVIVALMLLGGRYRIYRHTKSGKGGNIALIVLFGIGVLCGLLWRAAMGICTYGRHGA